MHHWCGKVLVFGGTLIFVELAKKIRGNFDAKERDKSRPIVFMMLQKEIFLYSGSHVKYDNDLS